MLLATIFDEHKRVILIFSIPRSMPLLFISLAYRWAHAQELSALN